MPTIEEEIQQARFVSPYQRLVVNLFYTASWAAVQQARRLKPFGLTTEQFNVLRILRGQQPQPATVNLITERMIDKTSNASRLVDKLLAKALVARHVCPHDRRAVDVCITPEGLALLGDIDAQQADFERTFTTLTPAEANTLSNLLDKMRG